MSRFSSIALVDPRGWVLLQERDEHPVIDPEKWGFPGGGVEPGESWEDAAYRELEEETGIALSGGLELFDEFSVRHAHRDTDDTFCLFTAPTELGNADVDCKEGRQIVFVDPERARGLDLTVAAAKALPRFLASERYRSLLR
ncbi:NUDIX domain-containing protein [Nocardioides bizhenqiangii]|uniref:NUDIX domain-containing protein n=1 Tax=Nocardioides bizhenqiangii TaxID=3095076 RepID=A0ABZ0ZLR4_9ACTN|nr:MULTISPECIES: NUDIX domain-containing protein [unclassified Nocardioides]MDZ5620520.1 NUDIX domain-containing protein [Nocardioides sp. HM23]WQQ24891.1 NUDIX domain-containing protein [Nocardioides sp. HM61]